MNNFKRLMAVLLVLATVFAFAACTSGSDNTTNSQKPQQSNPSSSTSKPAPSVPGSSSTQPTQPPAQITFRIRVEDESGNPVVGMYVQLCNGNNCTTGQTGEDGWANFTNAFVEGCETNLLGFETQELEDRYDYSMHMDGYTPIKYHFEGDSMEFTYIIKLKAAE